VALFLSAFLFAALHCNPWQFLSPLFVGLAFGWFYLRTGSLGLCMLAHALSNALALASTVLPLGIPGLSGTPDPHAKATLQPWWLSFSGLGVLLVGLWAFSEHCCLSSFAEAVRMGIDPKTAAYVRAS
jgi:hypothetical protein